MLLRVVLLGHSVVAATRLRSRGSRGGSIAVEVENEVMRKTTRGPKVADVRGRQVKLVYQCKTGSRSTENFYRGDASGRILIVSRNVPTHPIMRISVKRLVGLLWPLRTALPGPDANINLQ